MDNDDNDYQGHGLHLAGEESSKHSPVLRPYALHKFDFEEGHLRFDSLVENEVFLGIPSQEDNQWIEDFSRGSSGIEFSSSAAETCSIPRHNNVWSEATSSESVEMLLKSVGQEEIVAGETIIEESDAGDVLPSLSQPMDLSSSQDARADEIIDHSSELPPTEFLGSFTSLDPNPKCDVTRSNFVSQPGEVDLSAYGYSSSIGEKTSTTAEENIHVTRKCNESNVKKDHSSLVESLNNKMQEDHSVSALETGSDEHSPPNIVMGAGQLNVEDKMSNVSHESIGGPQESPKMGDNSMPEKKSVVDDEKLSKISAEASVTGLHYAVHVASKLEAIVESALETTTAGVPESSSLPTDINSNLLTVKGCAEQQCSTESAQSSRSGLVTSGIESTVEPEGESILPEKSSRIHQNAGDGSSRGQIKELSNHAIYSELNKEPLTSTSADRRNDYLEISGKICTGASTIVADASSLMQIEQISHDEHAKINGDNNVLIPPKSVSVGSVGAEVVTESSTSADGATEIHNDNPKSIYQISPSEPAVSSDNSREVSSEQALQDCNQDIPVQERDGGNFAFDSNNATDETAEPYHDVKKFGLSALDEVTEESVEKPHGLEFDASVGNEPASNAKIEDNNTGSHERVDDVPSLPVSGTTGEVCNHHEDGKSKPSALETLHPDKDDVEMEAPQIDSSIPLLESRDAVIEKLSDSIAAKGAPDNSDAVVVSEDFSQSLSLVESSDKAIQVEQAAAGLNQEQADKIELSSVKADLDLRKSAAAEVAELLKPKESTAAKDHGIPSTSAGGDNSSEVQKPDAGSVSVIISTKLLQMGVKKQEGTVEGMVAYVPQPDGVEGVGNSSLTTISPGKNDAIEEERSFTFDVSPLVGLSESETTKGWRTISSNEAVKTSTPVEGFPSTSGCGQTDSLVLEVSHGSTQKLDKRAVAGGSKSASDRKTRRGSGKSAKENARKGNLVKDTVSLRQTEKADTSSAFFSPSGTCKLMPVELGNVERSGTKPTGVVSVSGSSLPDLNMSTPPSVLFHQPFTDLQQVQLRAQIFVYGSLMQGVAPDEACMVSAFGISDGGASIWEPAWRAYMERLHGQKPHPSNSETPVQSRSGAKALDKGKKQGSNQSKVRASSKSTPSPAINPMIPLSSPLWNVPTPSCDTLPTNNLARGAVLNYQALSPIHAYRTPALRNLAGHTTSWVSQAPFPVPWVASPQSSPFDVSSHFPALHTTETVKVTAVKESSTPASSVAKHSSPSPASGGSAVSLDKSKVNDPKKTTDSHTPDTADPKSRKRKKSSGSEDLGLTSFPISQKVSVSTAVRNTPAASKGPAPQDLGTASLLARSQGPAAPQDLCAASLLARSQGPPAPQDLGAASLLAQCQSPPAPQDPGAASLLARSRAELVSASTGNSQISTSVVIPGPSVSALKINLDKSLVAVSTISSRDHPKSVNRALEKRDLLSEDIAKVAEAKLQAEEAAAHAAVAVSHCQNVWSELDKQKNSGLMSDVEANIASAAAAIAAASSVAKAAAAAAKIASNAAIQAKRMADEALISTNIFNPFRNDPTSPPGFMNSMGNATSASILKVGEGNNGSSSIIIAAREASRRRMEAASAASRHAENLDAVVKAAELAAEAVSQAGKIVALGEPLPLSKLAEAGPEGYWKITAESGRDAKSNNVTVNTSNVNIVEEVPAVIEQQSERPSDKDVHSTDRVASPHLIEAPVNTMQDHIREEECIPASVSRCDNDLRGTKSRRTSDMGKTINVVPESEIGLRSMEQENTTGVLNDNSIKENCVVEVFKDNGDFGAWFSASMLDLKDGNALVCYTELKSEEGKLKEWVPLESHGSKPPIIRPANPISSLTYEGTRKRRRAAVRDHVWSLGDRVDAWMGSCWREGVIVEKNKKDESTLSVHFPVQGKISAVKAWHLRSTRIWKDGEWIELPSSGQDHSFQDGDTPHEKRVKLGSPAIEGKGKAKMSNNVDASEPRKPEESSSLPLSAAEIVFNVGSTKNDNKPEALRTRRSGLQKEGSRVIFGVPKPGKKRKFMEVSKHYTSDRSTKNSMSTDSEKFAKYLMPQGSGARAWKNGSKVEPKEKQAAESKSRGFKPAKPPSVSTRTLPRREVSSVSAPRAAALSDSMARNTTSNDRDEGERNLDEFVSSSNVEEGAGPTPLSSHAPSSTIPKKLAATNFKSERLRKGRPAHAGGKSSKVEEKEKLVPEVVEPRRSIRKIQPTSRLLEGLQSSLIIPKFPPVSHDKSHRNQNKGASKGNN